MGQWHQALIIAKVKPHDGEKHRYRCLGSIYHSWCYGSLPVKGAHRFITLIKQELNARIVQEELDAVQGKYGAYGKEEPRIPDVPCVIPTCKYNEMTFLTIPCINRRCPYTTYHCRFWTKSTGVPSSRTKTREKSRFCYDFA